MCLEMKMEFEGRFGQAQRQKYDCLLFDQDDTLYPVSAGLAAGVLKNMKDYMVEKLGIFAEKIPELCNLLYKNYGATMGGIRVGLCAIWRRKRAYSLYFLLRLDIKKDEGEYNSFWYAHKKIQKIKLLQLS
ncbi:unnamed protein product [Lactuca saligna]|uniref:Uncharacterized protein n=1 Tax=Lactuca saligna TaxID=75948 RepID=A0AA35V363_LACSI|nr:unnamed protein product [Lactuca saligna]